MSSGIASALRALRPEVPVYAAEVATAAPLAAALEAGEPTEVPYTASFVDGIGSTSVLEEMWPLVSELLAGSLVSDLDGSPPRFDSSPKGTGSWPRARAPLAWRLRSVARPGTARSCASSRAATSTPQSSPASSLSTLERGWYTYTSVPEVGHEVPEVGHEKVFFSYLAR